MKVGDLVSIPARSDDPTTKVGDRHVAVVTGFDKDGDPYVWRGYWGVLTRDASYRECYYRSDVEVISR